MYLHLFPLMTLVDNNYDRAPHSLKAFTVKDINFLYHVQIIETASPTLDTSDFSSQTPNLPLNCRQHHFTLKSFQSKDKLINFLFHVQIIKILCFYIQYFIQVLKLQICTDLPCKKTLYSLTYKGGQGHRACVPPLYSLEELHLSQGHLEASELTVLLKHVGHTTLPWPCLSVQDNHAKQSVHVSEVPSSEAHHSLCGAAHLFPLQVDLMAERDLGVSLQFPLLQLKVRCQIF